MIELIIIIALLILSSWRDSVALYHAHEAEKLRRENEALQKENEQLFNALADMPTTSWADIKRQLRAEEWPDTLETEI